MAYLFVYLLSFILVGLFIKNAAVVEEELDNSIAE